MPSGGNVAHYSYLWWCKGPRACSLQNQHVRAGAAGWKPAPQMFHCHHSSTNPHRLATPTTQLWSKLEARRLSAYIIIYGNIAPLNFMPGRQLSLSSEPEAEAVRPVRVRPSSP